MKKLKKSDTKQQKINVDDLIDFIHIKRDEEMVYASELPNKKLTFTISGAYKVYHNGVLYKHTYSKFTAVDTYNSL